MLIPPSSHCGCNPRRPDGPATYAPERIADPALAALQAKVVSVDAGPEFDATYAWKMGGRVHIITGDGATVERTVHGQSGSMHAPLGPTQLHAKFDRLTSGRAGPGLAEVIGSIGILPVTDLSTELLAIRRCTER